jgi:hypothetical protein
MELHVSDIERQRVGAERGNLGFDRLAAAQIEQRHLPRRGLRRA